MNAFIIELLQAIATAAIPVCAAYLVQYLRRKSEQIIAQTDNMTIKAILSLSPVLRILCPPARSLLSMKPIPKSAKRSCS
ncbi:hypothetical protein D7X25_36590, partial [bacterium 1XD42-8]